ncbi:MAG: hypothetical protein V7K21_19200 [Nostoc sp.]|uniref:hypothetical protein n=1 Tax=Nostoc sp. TaxID=1180 RepID=UPI002FF652CB
MINRLACKILARIFIKLPHNLMLDILKRLEVGVYLFCRRQSVLYPELKDLLEEQAVSEYRHAQAFATLANLKLHLPPQHLIDKPESLNWNRLTWSEGDWGEPVDGISTRFLSSRLFFKGRTASDYDLSNKLAFMHVLENLQISFYKQLAKFCSSDVRKTINKIVRDENEHSDNLLSALQAIEPEWEQLINYWQMRQNLALLLLPIDLALYLFTHILRLAMWVCFG